MFSRSPAHSPMFAIDDHQDARPKRAFRSMGVAAS